jgi:hypothetical protein
VYPLYLCTYLIHLYFPFTGHFGILWLIHEKHNLKGIADILVSVKKKGGDRNYCFEFMLVK